MKTNLLDEAYLNKYVKKEDTIIVAVSTGIDSMCLFHYLYSNSYNIVVAHVNHKKRAESDQEYSYLMNFCKENNIPFEGYEIKENIKSNFQEEARKIRYKFFIDVAKKYNSKHILLAHQADDEVETVLMRLIRGTSIKGYSGIHYDSKIDDINIIRPLLFTPRSTIELYQKENNITYFLDSSNNENHYTRNIFRHNIIPSLKELNPNIYESVKNYSTDLYEMSSLVVDMAKDFINNNSERNEDEIIIKSNDFAKLKPIVKREVLLECVNYISKDTVELYHSKIQAILDIIDLNMKESKAIEIKDDIIFVKEYENIVFTKKKAYKKIDLYIEKEGEYEIEGYGKVVFSQKNHLLPSKNSYMLCYNSEDEIYPIHVRNVKIGDKISYSSITKKVYDLLKEYKIPKRLRESVLVFEKDNDIFFIPNVIRKETDTNKKHKIYITFIGGIKWKLIKLVKKLLFQKRK